MTDELPIERVSRVLRSLRCYSVIVEHDLQLAIDHCLRLHSQIFEREVKLAPRCRIDFLTHDNIGIEAKKGKPNSARVVRQLERYVATGRLEGVVLVVERSVFDLPPEIGGVPIRYVSVNANWGIAL